MTENEKLLRECVEHSRKMNCDFLAVFSVYGKKVPRCTDAEIKAVAMNFPVSFKTLKTFLERAIATEDFVLSGRCKHHCRDGAGCYCAIIPMKHDKDYPHNYWRVQCNGNQKSSMCEGWKRVGTVEGLKLFVEDRLKLYFEGLKDSKGGVYFDADKVAEVVSKALSEAEACEVVSWNQEPAPIGDIQKLSKEIENSTGLGGEQ